MRGILTPLGDRYAFRDRTTQDLFELWLRPSLQARIAQRIDQHVHADDEDTADDARICAD